MLITGASAIGKSELALELISRGNGLIADDIVELFRISPDTIEGRCPDVLRDFLEVRGIGVLNIRTIFGETAVRPRKLLRLIVHLEDHGNETFSELDRLQVNATYQEVLAVPIRKVTIPVAAGRNLAVLVEAAVRNFVLNQRGIDSTKEFIERQQKLMEDGEATERRKLDLRADRRRLRLGQERRARGTVRCRLFRGQQPAAAGARADDRDLSRKPAKRASPYRSTRRTGPGPADAARRHRRRARCRVGRHVPLSRHQDRHAGEALLGNAPPPSVLQRRAHADRGRSSTSAACSPKRASSASRSTPATCRRPHCAPGSRISSRSTARGSRCCSNRSASRTAPRSTPTWCSTCAACPIRITSRRCGR